MSQETNQTNKQTNKQKFPELRGKLYAVNFAQTQHQSFAENKKLYGLEHMQQPKPTLGRTYNTSTKTSMSTPTAVLLTYLASPERKRELRREGEETTINH